MSRLDVITSLLYSLTRIPSRPEPVAEFREPRFEHGAQHLMQCLLDEPVQHRGYPNWRLPPPGLGISTFRTAKSSDRHHAYRNSACQGATRHAWRTQKKRPPKWPLLNRSSSQALADVSSFAAYQINKPNAILLSTSARL